jgi:FMN phosphatase YigB (HAD superfamily)
MRIVMDFDGVFTDPTEEGDACSKYFRDKIISLGLEKFNLHTQDHVDSWFGELRARQAAQPFSYGWRSEGRVSAFTFEDPFIRNIGLADFLDYLASEGDPKAKAILARLTKEDKIKTFGELSEQSFLNLKLKKRADPGAKKWVESAIAKGHEVFIVSNSATDKIQEFLNQNSFHDVIRPQVRGGARKFGLGKKARPILIGKAGDDRHSPDVKVDTDRPIYEEALMSIKPDAIIGDVFSLDLSLPIRLKREKKLDFKWGIFYRHREYTPTRMMNFVSARASLIPEVTVIREWGQLPLDP